MDYQIFLTTGTPDRRYGEPQTDYYALSLDYFEAALRARDLRPPTRIELDETVASLGGAIEQAADRIARRFDPRKMNIVGLTNRIPRSFVCIQIARRLRAHAAQRGIPLMVIGGGPHFARESLQRNGEVIPDSVSNALMKSGSSGQQSPPYDAVICGGFGAFIELVSAVESDQIAEHDGIQRPSGPLPRGYYYYDRSTAQLMGQGRSSVPAMGVMPITLLEIPEKGGCSLVTIFSNACIHGCDFCSLPKYVHFTKDQVVAGIRQTIERYGAERVRNAIHLTVWDPTPLSAKNRDRTYEYLSLVWREIGRPVPPELCLCGPHELLTNPAELLYHIEELRPVKVNIGRDAIGEPGASFMGCKQRGRLKPAGWLREEQAGLEEVIRCLKERKRRITVELSYIISPVETVESLNELFDEMERLCGLSDGNLAVTADWSFLYPCPGAALLREKVDLVSDLVYDTLDHLGAWDRELVLSRYPETCLPAMERIFGPNITGDVYQPEHHEKIRQLRG